MDLSEEQSGIVFNIQRFSVHDGPGIRTTVFLKGCPLKCFWCQNPESQKRRPEIFLNPENCTGCAHCVSVCPTGASTLKDGHSAIKRQQCEGCGSCVENCQNDARTLIGKYMAVSEVVHEVIKDKKFYDNSEGGVTLSGGEPLYQPEFAGAILKRCKEAGLHTAIETCGYAPWPVVKKLLDYTDLVLYDIKCIDSKKHRDATGQSNELILENARKLVRCITMRVRVPLVPGFNDSPHEVRAIVNFVKKELRSVEIDLLPYNRLGECKYRRLDRPAIELQNIDEDHLKALEKLAKFHAI